jgi:HAD superfamily phosphoserine phosphatase-like hydrolase
VIVASDLEGTITTGETWRGVAAYLESHGRKVDYARFRRSKLAAYIAARVGLTERRAFQNAWITDLTQLFAGQSLEAFCDVAAWVVTHELLPKQRPNVIAELEAARRDGARVILASGTYQPILEVFAAQFGFEAIGTPLEVVDGKLTGRLRAPVNVGTHKRANLMAILNGQVLTRAYGDTFPDIPMLELAQQAVIVRGNDMKLERVARKRTWRVTQ